MSENNKETKENSITPNALKPGIFNNLTLGLSTGNSTFGNKPKTNEESKPSILGGKPESKSLFGELKANSLFPNKEENTSLKSEGKLGGTLKNFSSGSFFGNNPSIKDPIQSSKTNEETDVKAANQKQNLLNLSKKEEEQKAEAKEVFSFGKNDKEVTKENPKIENKPLGLGFSNLTNFNSKLGTSSLIDDVKKSKEILTEDTKKNFQSQENKNEVEKNKVVKEDDSISVKNELKEVDISLSNSGFNLKLNNQIKEKLSEKLKEIVEKHNNMNLLIAVEEEKTMQSQNLLLTSINELDSYWNISSGMRKDAKLLEDNLNELLEEEVFS